MKRTTLKILLFLLLFLSCSGKNNVSIAHQNDTVTFERPKHRLSHVWGAQSFVGLFGILLNGLLLKIFVSEKKTFTTSINLMIWYI